MGRLVGPLKVTGAFWFRLHHFGVRIVPRWMVPFWVRLFTGVFFLCLLRIRRAIAGNLEPVLGPAGWAERQRRIHRTMLSFAWCLTERYEWLAGARRSDLVPEGFDAWRRADGDRRGVIVITAHMGNWEMGASLPNELEQRRVHLVREEELDPRAQSFIADLLRRRLGERFVTHFARDDPRLALRLHEALRDGDVVALQADRPRRGGKTVQVELFGRPFALPVGPFALARAAEAPLVPVFVLRRGRGLYRLCFRPAIRVVRTGDRDADVAAAARACAARIEWAIREAPHQWFCFRSLWRER